MVKPIKVKSAIEVKETKELFDRVEAEIQKLTTVAKADIDKAAKEIIKKYIEDKNEKD